MEIPYSAKIEGFLLFEKISTLQRYSAQCCCNSISKCNYTFISDNFERHQCTVWLSPLKSCIRNFMWSILKKIFFCSFLMKMNQILKDGVLTPTKFFFTLIISNVYFNFLFGSSFFENQTSLFWSNNPIIEPVFGQ